MPLQPVIDSGLGTCGARSPDGQTVKNDRPRTALGNIAQTVGEPVSSMRTEGRKRFSGERECFKKSAHSHGCGSEPVGIPYKKDVIAVHIGGKFHGKSRPSIVFPFFFRAPLDSGMFRWIGVRSLDFQHIPAHGGMAHPGHGSGIAGVGKIRDQHFGLFCSRAGRKAGPEASPPQGREGEEG